jgi:hypothetical protein
MDFGNYRQTALIRNRIIFVESGLIVFILIALTLKFCLLFLLNINWDEFLTLAAIYEHNLGTLKNQFQTFQVHFFKWLPLLTGDEISQIIAARIVLFLIGLGSCLVTYLISRHFLNRTAALSVILCYIAFSFIIEHGTSFRWDPICGFLFLISIFLLIKMPHSMMMTVISGLVMALSLMFSIKTVFYLLTIAAIFLFRLLLNENKKNTAKPIMVFLMGISIFYYMFYSFHIWTLPESELRQLKDFLSSAYSKVIIFNDFFPRWIYFKQIFFENLLLWTLFIVGITYSILELIKSKKNYSIKTVFMFTFLIPLFSLLFYRNAFPYFYVFIISPAIVFSGVFIHRIVEDFKKTGSVGSFLILTIISIAIFFNFLIHYNKNSTDQIIAQKEIIQLVHKIFPGPVPYIDRCSMVSSFPKVGVFMSTWGMENYLEANTPIMNKLIISHQPVFLLANSPSLDLSLPREMAVYAGRYSLLEEDWNTLKSNFIHHWGILYVAGKQFNFDSEKKSHRFEIKIPGIYTYEGETGVYINGALHEDGDVIQFEKGYYTISSLGVPVKSTLRWGNHIYKPSKNPSTVPIFYGF